ncbi:MAG: hypothetical protein JWR61_901 [Ferruginibacter sp.]|uniref:DUF5777 family beta-barrel protein n=1 Tax=Ferruginibacter sp. TaxID=1940288 RepID=UPI002657D69F|nr:DUF5777 family beta-barrel protein [Ferruginibacter sp.]MDB5275946.1 hypothetical protein [Ferruginibacter sp.]
MKLKIKIPNCLFAFITLLVTGLLIQVSLVAQDSTGATATTTAKVKMKPVKNTFQSVWIIDNQTVMVPVKGTFEMDIMHRFGTVQKGYDDFWGFFAPSNIRLGVSYAPVNKLNVGIGLTKSNMLWDASAKYSIITQTKGKYPVSITYYGDVAYDTRKDADKSIFKYQSQRLLFFNQVIIARKITDKFSVQVAPSISHQNAVNGYYTKNDSTGTAKFSEMKHDHFALAVSARYKLTTVTSVMVNYDQPLTKHATNNPNPNLSFGVEFNTSNHSFQLFMGNYSLLNPQRNNLYNTNSPFGYTDVAGKKVSGGKFLIGFNITRLWNY